MNPYDVLQKPLLSEKSNEVRESLGYYSFLVNPKASKTDIKAAVEKMFEVNVVAVNTCLTRGKVKRRGNTVSLTKKKKKAVIQLAAGQKLAIFEDQ
jgi:large subunit ribosomal protein L23